MYDLLETSLADRHVYCSSRILRNSEDLLEFLNKGVADRGIALTMAKGKVVMAIASHFMVSFSPYLVRKLGFVPISTYGVGEHIASHGADLTVKNVETLFVYCNVLEHVVVGDGMAPLLRIVGMKRKAEHDRMHKILNPPLYVPLQKKRL